MPIITSIKPQKNQKRVNIYLDGKFAFGLDLENFLKLGLKVEEELTEKEIKQIVEKAEFSKILSKLLRFASLRPRSEKEYFDWLKRRKVHESMCSKLCQRLKQLDLVNDERFTRWWIEQRLTFRPRSQRHLKFELRQKGIDNVLIDKILAKVKPNEVEIIKKILAKNMTKWAKYQGAEKKQKMREFCGRKGFAWENIKKGVDEFLASE